MPTTTIAGLPAGLAANIDDTAIVEMEDALGNSIRATIAQLRTALSNAAQTFQGGITVPSVGGSDSSLQHLQATQVYTASNDVSMNTGVATDMITLQNAEAIYDVSARVLVQNAQHSATAKVACLGNATAVLFDVAMPGSSLLTLTLSGQTIRATQTVTGTATVRVTVLRRL